METDKIIIKGLRIYAYHGVNDDENEKGQPFEFDITCYSDLTRPCRSDNVIDTVSYAQIIKLVKRLVTEDTYNLIEYTAQQVADGILKEFREIKKVTVLIKKPRAPILADFEYVAVEITRER